MLILVLHCSMIKLFQVSFRYHIEVIREWRSVNQLTRVINKKSLARQPVHSHVLIHTPKEEHVFPHVHTLQ